MRKLQQNRFYDKTGKLRQILQQNGKHCVWFGDILHIRYMKDVGKCQISLSLSCGESELPLHAKCEEISDFSTYVMWRNLNFFHMANFSPQVPPVVCNCDKYQVWCNIGHYIISNPFDIVDKYWYCWWEPPQAWWLLCKLCSPPGILSHSFLSLLIIIIELSSSSPSSSSSSSSSSTTTTTQSRWWWSS